MKAGSITPLTFWCGCGKVYNTTTWVQSERPHIEDSYYYVLYEGLCPKCGSRSQKWMTKKI